MAIIRTTPSERVVQGKLIVSSESAIVSDSQFITRGEGIVIVKSIDFCKVTLDHTTTDHVTVKALTKVLIIPAMGKIDDEYDEISIDVGACVEFAYCAGGWYILSSDGLKNS
jgi:hypothetical protein